MDYKQLAIDLIRTQAEMRGDGHPITFVMPMKQCAFTSTTTQPNTIWECGCEIGLIQCDNCAKWVCKAHSRHFEPRGFSMGMETTQCWACTGGE